VCSSDLAALRKNAETAAAYDRDHAAALAALRNCPKPVAAMIEGFCIGGGIALAMACDLRYAGPTATFALPPAKLGLAYPTDSLRDLLSAVGADTAKEMIFTARRLSADEALARGLLTAVASDVEAHVRAIAAEIAVNAPRTMTAAKATIDFITGRNSPHNEESLDSIANACFDSEDYAEGQRAFMEKRKPVFTGK
jgi:enoyl-CoA hydratase/carnithine racemase